MSIDFNGDLRNGTTIVPPYAKTSTSTDSIGGTWTQRTSGGSPRFVGKPYWRTTIANGKSREEAHEDGSESFAAIGVPEGSRAFYALSVRYPSAGWYGTSNFGLFLQIKNKISNTYPGGLSPQVALDHKQGVGLRLALRGGQAGSHTSILPVVLANPPLDTWMDFILEVYFDRAVGQARLYYKTAADTSFTKIYENLSTPTMYIDAARVGAEINPPNFCRVGYYRGPETTPLYADHTGHIRTTTYAEAEAFFTDSLTGAGMAGASISQPVKPAQLAGIFYDNTVTIPTKYRAKTALVILGRTPTNPGRVEAAAAGAIVGIYFNVTTYSNVGTYHNMFFNAGTVNGNSYGAVGSFPRGGNGYGPPVDFTSSIAVAKYEDVLRVMAAANPWCRCIFMDDQGPDYSGYNTTSFYTATYNGQPQLNTADKANARAYQIALAQAARRVADQYGLLLITNAEWRADTGNGYPASNTPGCALYDLTCIEHHTFSETFWSTTTAQGQWRLRDPNGRRANFVISVAGDTANWKSANDVAWLTEQTGNAGYNQPTVDSGLTTHDIGFSVTGTTPSITVTVSPTTANLQTGNTQALTGTASNSATMTWAVNGVVGGNSTVGTITPTTGTSVTYTAPVGVPAGGTVTVTASVSTGQSGSCSISISTSAPPPPSTTLPAPPNPDNKTFGNRFAGTIPNNMTPDFSRGVFVNAPEGAKVNKIYVGIDGGGPGTADQPFKCVLYNVDSLGNPSSLIATTAEYTITSGLSARWVGLAFSTPPSLTANSTYFLAIHSGGTENTGRFYRNDSPLVSRSSADPYGDGPLDPYPSSAAGNADISIYADYSPTGVVSSHMVSNNAVQTNFAFNASTVTATAVTSVTYVLVPVTRTIPVAYEDLGNGQLGAQLNWNSSTRQFERAT